MRKLNINFAARQNWSIVAPFAAVFLLAFAVFLTWHNAASFLDNASRLRLLKERAAELEKTIPAKALANVAVRRSERASLIADIEFINEYALRKSFSWTELLTRFEEGLPKDVQLVSISPEFKGGKVSVSGSARSMGSALFTVESLGKAGFEEVFLLRHARDEISGLVLFDISARYRASS